MSAALRDIWNVSITTGQNAYAFCVSVFNTVTNPYAVDRKDIKPAIKSGNIERLNKLLDVANYGDSIETAYEQLVKKPVFTYNESACSFAASKAVNEFVVYFSDTSTLPTEFGLRTFILLRFIDQFHGNKNLKDDLVQIIDAMDYKPAFQNDLKLQDAIKSFCLSLCDYTKTDDGFELHIDNPPLECSIKSDLSGNITCTPLEAE